MTREQIEQGLRDFLGISTIVWLPYGHSLDVGPAGTDGHVDGVAQYVAPGHVRLEVPSDPASPEFDRARENLARLERGHDASGRSFTISRLDPGPDATVSFANFYLANGGVVVPVGGTAADGPALEFIGSQYPGREVVGVPGETLLYGGGGPHCITQQIPEGKPAARP
jgi:agmatine deiminase